MAKISVVVLADIETHGDLGRIANALSTVKEASEAGDEVELVFDGAGTRWIPELAKPDNKLGPSLPCGDHGTGPAAEVAGSSLAPRASRWAPRAIRTSSAGCSQRPWS